MLKSPITIFAVLVVCAAGSCRKNEKAAPAPVKQQSSTELKKDDIKVGEGPVATKGKIVQVHYTGYLSDGAQFDTTRNRKPLQFQLGSGTVLKGWDLGIEGMKVGGKRKLTVPPALAFGDRAVGQIKPNSTLVFDMELVTVQ